MESVLHNCMEPDTGVRGLLLFFKSIYLRSGPASSDPNALKRSHCQAFNQITAFENCSLNIFSSLSHGRILWENGTYSVFQVFNSWIRLSTCCL